MRLVAGFTDLWEIPRAECGLVDGEMYHYWFEVTVPRRRPEHPGGSASPIPPPRWSTGG